MTWIILENTYLLLIFIHWACPCTNYLDFTRRETFYAVVIFEIRRRHLFAIDLPHGIQGS